MTNRSLLFSAILLSATAMASLAKATYIPLTPTLGGNSAYTLSEITDEQAQGKSNVFVHYELGADNQLISHYYQYDIKRDSSSNSNIYASSPVPLIVNGNFIGLWNEVEYIVRPGRHICFGYDGTYGECYDGIHDPMYGDDYYEDEFVPNYQDGGAINLAGKIESITGDFIGNRVEFSDTHEVGGKQYMRGGAINNDGTIGNIVGDFVGNFISQWGSDNFSNGAGGAIANYSYMRNGVPSIGDITGNFIGNYISVDNVAYGGAIANNFDYNSMDDMGNGQDNKAAVIGNITGNFIGNYASSGFIANGGAIYNANGSIGNITGTIFSENRVTTPYSAAGGFLYNNGIIGNISGNMIRNTAKNSGDGNASGGAIINSGIIGDINGDFGYNQAIGNRAFGGAILNSGSIGKINGNFFGNRAEGTTQATGGAIHNRTYRSFMGSFADNNSGHQMWWQHDTSATNHIDNLNGNIFVGNAAVATTGNAYGGAIANIFNLSARSAFGDIESTMSSMVPDWQTLSDEEKSDAVKEFLATDYYSEAVYGDLTDIVQNVFIDHLLNLTNVSFLNNSATGNNEAKGGAIYSESDVNITADGTTSLFRGNTANGESNAIYMAPQTITLYQGQTTENLLIKNPTLSLSAVNGGVIHMDDGIDGNAGYKIVLNGDASGTINLNAAIKNAGEINVKGATVNFNAEQDGLVYNQLSGITNVNAVLSDSTLTVGEGVSGISSKAAVSAVMIVADNSYLNGNNALTVNSGQVNIGNLDNSLHFNKLVMNGGQLNIENVGVDLADQVMGTLTADEYSKEAGTIDVKNVKIKTDGTEDTTTINFTNSLIADKVISEVKESLGPVWKYQVSYNQETGDFEFYRPGTVKPEDPANSGKPNKPCWDDVNPEVMAPVVAAASTVAVLNDEIYSRVLNDVDALGRSTPHVSSSDRSIKNAWVKTFGSKDSVDLKNFRGADTKFYGFIGGLSSDRINEGHGWSAIYSVYGAYASGEQKFAGEKVTNNGGYLGLGANFYNGDFFIGTTINGGLIRNRSDKTGVDGKDKFNSYVGGIAGKTGYDYHIGSFTVEPNVYASYTIIGADDYMTKSGAKVEFGKMGVIEAAPGLKLSRDFGHGLQGYVSGRYVWTFTEGEHVKANQFTLPDVELEDYAEYGIGLEKNWHGSSGFVEVKRRDGGRNGWNLTAGYKRSF